MDQYEAVIKLLIEAVKESVSEGTDDTIPVGVSNRHVHLSQKDLETLFGPGYELAKMKDLSQPGQYACKETFQTHSPSPRSYSPTISVPPVTPLIAHCISGLFSWRVDVEHSPARSGSPIHICLLVQEFSPAPCGAVQTDLGIVFSFFPDHTFSG